MLELELIQPTDVTVKHGIVTFHSKASTKDISQLGGLIKRGEVVDLKDLEGQIKDYKIVGVSSEELGIMIKRQYNIKRYKVLDLWKSDLDVKRKGGEVISFGKQKYGVVKGWQQIDLYSEVDFNKPASGMNIGMMPAKLTHILINIGRSLLAQSDEHTIYDPFCGFGTTNFMANAIGCHTIGSDSNITPAKQNHVWWKHNNFYVDSNFITLFKHDVKNAFEKKFLDNVDVVVTEGRLGPVIKSEMLKHQAQTETILKEYIPNIVDTYVSFITNLHEKLPTVPIVMTVPEYLWLDYSIIADRITESAREIGYNIKTINEVYKRKKQQVGRRILILDK